LASSEAGFRQERFSPSRERCGSRDIPSRVESSNHPGDPRTGRRAARRANRRDTHTPDPPGHTLGRLATRQTCSPVADYKCFNSSNVSIRPWSWNYRSCWHQTCPPVDTHDCVWIASIPSPIGEEYRRDCYGSSLPRRMFLHWAICVPAAHLGSGSRLSGSLSGIEP
jgi:hypothetical protein